MSVFHRLFALCALVCFAPTALAQAPTQDSLRAYQESFKKGIDALTAGRHDEGIAAFRRCLELVPEDATSAYNVACGQALKGEKDEAFQWLDKAADWGFGDVDGNIDHAATKDADLASLRTDPRFAGFIAKMNARKKAIEDYVAKPAIHVPAALADAAEVGLLVVLHDAGATKEQVLAGPWRKVADELGLVLIAPSGKIPAAKSPQEGMAWFDAPANYIQRYWTFEKPAQDAVSAFQKERKLDKSRVLIAGEGQGGILAANLALGSPGLYKGALVVDAPVVEQLASSKAPNAAKMGLRTAFLLREGGEAAGVADELRKRLAGWSLEGEVRVLPRARGEGAALAEELVTSARALLAPRAAAEASAPR